MGGEKREREEGKGGDWERGEERERVRGIEGKGLERKEGEGGGGAHCYTAPSTHKFTLARKWCESSAELLSSHVRVL